MNPFAMTNILRPTILADHRVGNAAVPATDLGYSMSRAAFRIIDSAGRLLGR